MTHQIWPGTPGHLGAVPDDAGTNFAVFTEHGEAVDLCLFNEDGTEHRLRLPESTAFIHHGYVPGVGAGQRYGFRVHGPWAPKAGHLFNPNKLLLDPYAKSIDGVFDWSDLVFAHTPSQPLVMDERDDASAKPRSVVVDGAFDWGDTASPNRPLHTSVIYETHVKGLTQLHPDVPPELRGTYAGMATEPVIRHLVQLGVTAVELQPVHHFVSEYGLVEKGMTNYWGYSSVGYFAPHASYAAVPGSQVNEFKALVKALHQAGIEVILDVVYNHTGEGGPLGPALSFRGIDNASYYRLNDAEPSAYVDYTGTGNTLNVRHPQVLKLIMDSLRYWVTEMRVDGFRFDLAASLARDLHAVDKLAAFFDLIHQDPVVSQVKLIAEPWDFGEGGYQIGNFPILWSEWNGKYRDLVRDFWRGSDWTLAEFASRFTGSSDLYSFSGRRPHASVNFVTSHDGFTLRDLVSYDHKHNMANGEQGRDGESHNRSWNSGVEGETEDEGIIRLRKRRARSILTTLMLSQGVPMLAGGDEIGRTQRGNNNAYCQDNEISWYDWSNVDEEMLAYAQELIRLRRDHPAFRRRRWFEGSSERGATSGDIAWFRNDGVRMTDHDWRKGYAKSLAVYLNGSALPTTDDRGRRVVDDSFLVLFNAHHDPVRFVMPDELGHLDWDVVLYSATGLSDELPTRSPAQGDVDGWSVALLRQKNGVDQ